MDFKAIRRTWRGQEYDSSLEANWAATLTAWGMDFKYHPGRMVLNSGDVWEPDFQVEGVDGDIIFEVKGYHNARIDKAWQADAQGYKVIIGREPFIPAGDNELAHAGAVWEPSDWVIKNIGSKLLWVREVDYPYMSNGDPEASLSAQEAAASGRLGIRFFNAVGEDGIE